MSEKPDFTKWDIKQIESRLCDVLNICSCQRYLDRCLHPAKKILEKLITASKAGTFLKPESVSDEELLIIAMWDQKGEFITHGTNIEYPITLIEQAQLILELIEEYEQRKTKMAQTT